MERDIKQIKIPKGSTHFYTISKLHHLVPIFSGEKRPPVPKYSDLDPQPFMPLMLFKEDVKKHHQIAEDSPGMGESLDGVKQMSMTNNRKEERMSKSNKIMGCIDWLCGCESIGSFA